MSGALALVKKWPIILALAASVSAAQAATEGGERRGFWTLLSIPGLSRVGLLQVEGPIYDARYYVSQIEKFRRNPMVKAMVVRIDSPGGEVGAVQEITESLRKFRESGKPVVASFGGVAASGGYYLACAADWIVSNPGALTGSIGVVMEFPNAENLLKKVGVEFVVVKSGRFKDTGGFARSLSDDERRLLQETIDDVYEQFLEAVINAREESLREAAARARKLDPKSVGPGAVRGHLRGIADGRVLSGRQALRVGLVDELGGLDLALEKAAALAGLRGRPGILTQRRRQTTTWRDLIGLALGWSGGSEGRNRAGQASLEYMLR